MMRRLLFVLTGLIIEGYGWNCDAHKIIAMIAASLLSHKTKRYIREHLPGREGSQLPAWKSALLEASCWADNVVGELVWSAELHFAHTPHGNCQAYEETRDCGFQGSGRCIVAAISNYTERASSSEIDGSERADALRFLIHFMGDAHQPLHVGFAEDFGGTHLMLSKPLGVSLHEVWDSFLVKTGKGASSETWFSLGSSLSEEVLRSGLSRGTFSVTQAKAFAASIVSEITTELTCKKAYKDLDWIESDDNLSEEYMKSRRDIALDQFKRAGVRLAQVLDEIASVYYLSERRIASLKLPIDSLPLVNRYEVLTIDLEPEDFVYEVDPETTKGTIVSEDKPEVFFPQIKRIAFVNKEAMLENTEEQRSRNQKKRDRKKVSKRKIAGVDLESLVLIKRDRRFFITYKNLVKSDSFVPLRFLIVSVTFLASGQPRRMEFHLDTDVFGESLPEQALLEAIFRKLQGTEFRPDTEARMEIKSEKCDGIPSSDVRASWAKALGLNDCNEEPCEYEEDEGSFLAPFRKGSLNTVENLIPRKMTAKELKKKYGGVLPTENQRINDAFNQIKSNLAVIQTGKIVFVTSFAFLKDFSNLRWVLNRFSFVDASVEPPRKILLLMDARVLDDALTREVTDELVRIGASFGCKSRIRKILERTIPPILHKVTLLSRFFFDSNDPLIPLELLAEFDNMTQINRPDVPDYYTTEYVLRNPLETSRARTFMRLDDTSLTIAERSILAQEFLLTKVIPDSLRLSRCE